MNGAAAREPKSSAGRGAATGAGETGLGDRALEIAPAGESRRRETPLARQRQGVAACENVPRRGVVEQNASIVGEKEDGGGQAIENFDGGGTLEVDLGV